MIAIGQDETEAELLPICITEPSLYSITATANKTFTECSEIVFTVEICNPNEEELTDVELMDNLTETLDAQFQTTAANLATNNSQIVTTYIYEENEKRVNDIFLISYS